jgi:hypothetical protein
VSQTEPIGCDRVDRALAGLPRGALVAGAGDARLVAGDTGAFVLVPAGDAAAGAAERAARLAEATRDALADHLSWVPFVDAVVVVRPDEAAHGPATAVPLDLLVTVLSEGRHVIAAPTLARIAALLAGHQLGTWRATNDAADGRIDPCPPIGVVTTGLLPATGPLLATGPLPSAAPQRGIARGA